MLYIKRIDIYWGFTTTGWLNIETGDVIVKGYTSETMTEIDGVKKHIIPKQIQDAPEKYIRLPHINGPRKTCTRLHHMGVDQSVLDKYDLGYDGYKEMDELVFLSDDEVFTASKRDTDFYERFIKMEDDLEIDIEDEDYILFGVGYNVEIIKKWCAEKGYALTGIWPYAYDYEEEA